MAPTEIAPGVHRLGSSMVNWYLVEDEGRLTAVDAGLPGFARELEPDLAALGNSLADVDALVLTHSDADHTGIAPRLREGGARVLIHADDEATLSRPRQKGGDASPAHIVAYMWRPTFWSLMLHFARTGGGRPPKVQGAETYADGDVLDVPGAPRAIHTPGHTPGHCMLLFERHGVLFVGDELCTWNPLTGRLGVQTMPSAFNVSNDAVEASLARAEGLEADVLAPGHGEPWHGAPRAAVAAARAAGRS